MLQFLDKATLGYAALFGLQTDIVSFSHDIPITVFCLTFSQGTHGTQFSWLTSILYIGKVDARLVYHN